MKRLLRFVFYWLAGYLLCMSTYSACARTNYFKVKDESAFRAFADRLRLKVKGEAPHFALIPGNYSDDFPTEDPQTGSEIDIVTEIARHLPEGEIAIIITIGREEFRYLAGRADAFNHEGRRISLDMEEIYARAQKAFGVKPTRAEY